MSEAPRPLIVDELVKAALDGMKKVENFSLDEMVSACFTLTKRTIEVVLEMHPDARLVVQDAIETLLMDCADEKKTN